MKHKMLFKITFSSDSCWGGFFPCCGGIPSLSARTTQGGEHRSVHSVVHLGENELQREGFANWAVRTGARPLEGLWQQGNRLRRRGDVFRIEKLRGVTVKGTA